MAKNKKLKDMSLNEASDFWDQHDFGEFNDVQEVDDIRFSLKKRKYIGIDCDLYAVIKNKAKSLNKTEETLINEWLSEKSPGLAKVYCFLPIHFPLLVFKLTIFNQIIPLPSLNSVPYFSEEVNQ